MEIVLAGVTGALYASGIYMMMRRSIFKLIMGIILLGHASNLLIFSVTGLVRGRIPIIAKDAVQLSADYPDLLPQALILTAIVIGFGVNAFAVVLIRRYYVDIGTDDLDEMKNEHEVG